MRRRRSAAFAWLLPATLAGGYLVAGPLPAPVLGSPPPAPPISGIVSHLEKPIAGALVILYNLGDASLTRARTAGDGTFVLASAPVGVYDLVAYKKGFLPSLVRLWHQAVPDSVSAVRIQLASHGASPARAPETSVWELRDRLPADVLRELSIEAGSRETASTPGHFELDNPIAGEVRTVTDMSPGETSLSRTAVGVSGGLPNGRKYDLRGDYSAVSDSAGLADAARTTGNSAGLALDVATSPIDRVRVTSRRHTLSFRDDRAASLQTHGVAWSHGGEESGVESVAARYIEETNLYRGTSVGTSFFPLASRTWEIKGRYARPAGDSPGLAVAMTYRHREGMVGPSGVGADGAFFLSAPDADLSAATSVKISSRLEVEGGVVARYLSGGYGIAPRAGVRYDLGSKTYVFVRGLYRVAENGNDVGTVLPLVVSIDESGDAAAHRGFAVGLERRSGDDASFRLEVSDQHVGEAVRAFFEGDFLTDFDSIYLFDGNTIRQYQATGSHRLSDSLSGSVAVRYGSIGGGPAAQSASSFGISDNAGRFWSARAAVEVVPTRTGVALLVRGVRQQMNASSVLRSNDSNKIAISVAQDLAVMGLTPFGSVCKLLLALERARSSASTDREDSPTTNRLMGGVAISF